MSRRPRELPPLPKRPYRDSLVLNLVLAGVILLLAWATGGDLGRAAAVAVAFLFVSTAWSWWRFRKRLEQEAER
jgi:membrane protein implicated in regulation of membrane protease activity